MKAKDFRVGQEVCVEPIGYFFDEWQPWEQSLETWTITRVEKNLIWAKGPGDGCIDICFKQLSYSARDLYSIYYETPEEDDKKDSMLWIPRDFEAEEMRYLGYILWSDREQAEMKYDKKKFYHHIQACFQQYGGAYDKGSKLSIKQLKKICDIIYEGEEDERN